MRSVNEHEEHAPVEDWGACPRCRRTRRAQERTQDRANTRWALGVLWHQVQLLFLENPWLRAIVYAWALYVLWCLVMVALCLLGLA